MRFISALVVFVVIGLGFVSSCNPSDDAPAIPENDISRLYISTSDFQTNEALTPFNNIFIVSPADSADFNITNMSYNSSVKGGSVIYFNPYAQVLFQASQNNLGLSDTIIYSLNYSITDSTIELRNKGRLGNGLFQSVKGMVFNPANNHLYVYDTTANAIFMVQNPANVSTYAKIERKFFLPETTLGWALTMNGNDLYMTRRGTNGGISIYEGITGRRDTLNTNYAASHSVTVSGSSNIRGISYDTVKNVLALTDYEVSGSTSTGKIYVFENVGNLKSQTTIAPTRVITGLQTGLQEPVDVAIDFRTTGHYIYVADQKAKKVFRFNLADQGDVAPQATYQSSNGLTPVSISLDARGPSSN
ncbi:hypothetical protein [Sphingobacterium hungaricum]|uniref:Lactonase, 7-bladed beta-propeller n=1 Tax=Sphingobacterium hungaricum TaxID=2082723 RepID=A0A928UWF5_9SPHI|nr:hypothetical protein [Sphingobacterium hungaricum]MBE8713208.1 hypothetical protein [Sphingobacterium hungaricum]